MGIYAKRPNETHQEYRDRVINKLSPSFCGAKWYNATIWLGNGTTTSCHHPPAHKIPLTELEVSYKAFSADFKINFLCSSSNILTDIKEGHLK